MYVLYCTAVNIVNVKTMVAVNDSITVNYLICLEYFLIITITVHYYSQSVADCFSQIIKILCLNKMG